MKEEPEIIINGQNVGPGCSMTIRVAIEVFGSFLIENDLGGDENGIIIRQNYFDRINDIRRAMGLINDGA